MCSRGETIIPLHCAAPAGPDISSKTSSNHSRQSVDHSSIPAAVSVAAQRVASPFFSVDVAERIDGTLRIIEIGDGQVSDRKHWPAARFVQMLRTCRTADGIV
jgi:hypothetical protein